MRTAAAALLTSIALTGLSASAQAQSMSSVPSPYNPTFPPRAGAPTDPGVRPAVTTTPSMSAINSPTTNPAVASAPGVKPADSSYWGPKSPPAPKRRQTLVRRFYNWVVGPEDTISNEEGLKVYRDPATGRTNTLGSKPWMEPKS